MQHDPAVLNGDVKTFDRGIFFFGALLYRHVVGSYAQAVAG